MRCLNCQSEMMNHRVQTRQSELAYDTCESCGSFWLDAGELDKLAFQVEGSVEYSSRNQSAGEPDASKICPRCEGVVLEPVQFIGYSDVVLDRCRNCGGYWLDGGELDRINTELESIMPVYTEGFSAFVKDVHLPFWHRRTRRKSSETDFTIEVPPLKGAVLKKKSSSSCPLCSTDLNVFSVFGIEIEACPDCRGIWLDEDELRSLKDQSEKGSWGNLRWMDDEVEAIANANAMPSNVSCPKCSDQRLLSVKFGGSDTIIDFCPHCHGIWLDRDELQAIIDHLKSQLDAMSSEEMVRKTYEEIKEIWGGPEGVAPEILDAKAAISALIKIAIYERPSMATFLTDISRLPLPR